MQGLTLLLLLPLVVFCQTQVCPSSAVYSNWMGQIQVLSNGSSASTAWQNQPLNNILIQGSHDAGLFKVTSKSSLGFLFSDSYFVTQKLDILGQLCSGARWFDMRFSKQGDQFLIYHGDIVVAYGDDLASISNQTKVFLESPENSKEVVFWRIKVTTSDAMDLLNRINTDFSSHLLKKPQPGSYLPLVTLGSIWATNPSGTLVLLNYDSWDPPSNYTDLVWPYADTYQGRYADATYMTGMLTKCNIGQQVRWTQYYQDNLMNSTNASRSIMGVWWTFTGGDIASNTQNNWAKYISPFQSFYVRNEGEIGNLIVSDFIGSFDFMTIVFTYNKNKYASFPPVSPIASLTIPDPQLPGFSLTPTNNSGTCTTGDNASEAMYYKVVWFFIGVCLGTLILLCCCCGLIYIAVKNPQKEPEFH